MRFFGCCCPDVNATRNGNQFAGLAKLVSAGAPGSQQNVIELGKTRKKNRGLTRRLAVQVIVMVVNARVLSLFVDTPTTIFSGPRLSPARRCYGRPDSSVNGRFSPTTGSPLAVEQRGAGKTGRLSPGKLPVAIYVAKTSPVIFLATGGSGEEGGMGDKRHFLNSWGRRYRAVAVGLYLRDLNVLHGALQRTGQKEVQSTRDTGRKKSRFPRDLRVFSTPQPGGMFCQSGFIRAGWTATFKENAP